MTLLENIFKIRQHPEYDSYRTIEFNWKKIWKIPEFAKLEECEQNPKWHGEGNAKIHTIMVCEEALKKVNEYAKKNDFNYSLINEGEKFKEYETVYLDLSAYRFAFLLLASALFHDIGKGVVTAKGKDGNWHSYNHEFYSDKITRKLLWEENVLTRENICSLVKYHMIPLNLMERKNYIEEMIKISLNIPSWELLLALKSCDLEGTKQKDEQLKEKDRRILAELAFISQEMHIYYGVFKSSIFYQTKRHHLSDTYLNGVQKPEANIVVVIGLPGAGKDTFINEKLLSSNENETIPEAMDVSRCNCFTTKELMTIKKEDAVVLSRDIIRAELGFCKEGEKVVCTSKKEEMVSEEMKKQIMEAAKKHKTMIFSNLNLKKEYREEYLHVLGNYNVNITYIIVEASTLQKNIDRREGQIPENVIKDMINNFAWPDANEYDDIYYIRT